MLVRVNERTSVQDTGGVRLMSRMARISLTPKSPCPKRSISVCVQVILGHYYWLLGGAKTKKTIGFHVLLAPRPSATPVMSQEGPRAGPRVQVESHATFIFSPGTPRKVNLVSGRRNAMAKSANLPIQAINKESEKHLPHHAPRTPEGSD